MRETIERPAVLVDVTGLSSAIEERKNGSLLIGAAVKNTALAEHRAVRTRYPMLTRAIVAGASAQIRNMATVGGNILQRTRCAYFYDHEGSRCNKRQPGQGCDALEGFNRMHAILGAPRACVATHPSDMCVALAALDAIVHLRNKSGERILPLTELHRLPEDHPEIETMLEPGELITAVELPPLSFVRRSTYRKVRDRASYAFALVSVAAALELQGNTVKDVRLALGGAGQVRDGHLKSIETIVQRQRRMLAKGKDDGLVLHRQRCGLWLLGARWQIGDGATLLPLGDGFGIDPITLGKRPQARLTILYCSTDRLCRCGASVKNLSHSASCHCLENNAPSNPGIKHLVET